MTENFEAYVPMKGKKKKGKKARQKRKEKEEFRKKNFVDGYID